MNKVYLAIPYSIWDMESSFVVANEVSAMLMAEGNVVFSPISHSHPISKLLHPKHHSHDFWMAQDLPMLDAMDEIVLVAVTSFRGDPVDGYGLLEKSFGCKQELMRATLNNKKIRIYEYSS
jgi:nucleoside 2-deoxyribosyltransferase